MIYFMLGFAPGIYWLLYFYKRDKLEPEPRKQIIIAYFAGIFIAIVIMLVQLPIRSSFFVSAVLIAPVIEELGKFLMVRTTVYKNKAFNEPMDGIVYASAVALGFASIENGFYLLKAVNVSKDLLSNVLLTRSLLSVPGHALFSSNWGIALGEHKFFGKRSGSVVKGLLLAILLHGLFNYLCFIRYYSAIGLLILLAIMWYLINRKIKRALKESPFLRKSIEPPRNETEIEVDI
ncbi:PrsW family intramembrane metalloprotease [Candidatus Cloacimonadota bacterium]